ncbi:unnamed protein product [Rhizoctonia solani]|uniref:MYND-type domain-containing protein n=1 Tax=Rhizoctonia solani TaxID=456999 RepID=A0A8H3DCU3_9AGAM|nr:unnamed protein product [Rhizoctonia solani]
MSSSSHPLWGRSTDSYEVPSDMGRSDISVDAERAGLLALQKVYQVPTGDPGSSQANDHISISTLESALALASDPRTIRHFVKRPAISGCSYLMQTITTETTATPSSFSYEYGRLCLNLLAYILNACLIEHWGKVKDTLNVCDRHPDSAAHRAFAAMVAREVDTRFDTLKDGGDCDWALGWSISHRHPRQTPLISRSDASALLSVLHPHHNHDWETLSYLLYELALQYMLVADKNQREATLRVVDSNKIVDKWQMHPKHVDPQDSRCIMTALIYIIAGEDKDLLSARDPYIMLRFVPLATDVETQDLLPEVILLTIVYCWAMLTDLDDEDEIEIFIQCFVGCLQSLIHPPHNRPYSLTPMTQAQIIDTMHDSDFLDLMARSIIRLKTGQSRSHTELNFGILRGLGVFFNDLLRAVPEINLAESFEDYVPIWWKVNQHLLTTKFSIPTLPISHEYHYDQCAVTWLEIAEILSLKWAIDNYANMKCYNGRCPMAHSTISQGARYTCAGCMRTMYCDARCQMVDWGFGGINPPDQESPVCGVNNRYTARRK